MLEEVASDLSKHLGSVRYHKRNLTDPFWTLFSPFRGNTKGPTHEQYHLHELLAVLGEVQNDLTKLRLLAAAHGR